MAVLSSLETVMMVSTVTIDLISGLMLYDDLTFDLTSYQGI